MSQSLPKIPKKSSCNRFESFDSVVNDLIGRQEGLFTISFLLSIMILIGIAVSYDDNEFIMKSLYDNILLATAIISIPASFILLCKIIYLPYFVFKLLRVMFKEIFDLFNILFGVRK